MATRKRESSNQESQISRRPPARLPEDRENQLIASAVDLAEKQIREGTASAQVITHYLKLGSSREKLEQQRLANEVELLKIKREAIESEKRVEVLYKEAMDAFRAYSGTPQPEQEDEDDPDFY